MRGHAVGSCESSRVRPSPMLAHASGGGRNGFDMWCCVFQLPSRESGFTSLVQAGTKQVPGGLCMTGGFRGNRWGETAARRGPPTGPCREVPGAASDSVSRQAGWAELRRTNHRHHRTYSRPSRVAPPRPGRFLKSFDPRRSGRCADTPFRARHPHREGREPDPQGPQSPARARGSRPIRPRKSPKTKQRPNPPKWTRTLRSRSEAVSLPRSW